MLEKLINADVLVFASPVYYFSISSQLKMFIDRTYAVIDKIGEKKFYFIATAAGPSKSYEEDLKKVVEPINGFVDCFPGLTFVRAICDFDTGNTDDMTKSPVFTEAETIGKAIGVM